MRAARLSLISIGKGLGSCLRAREDGVTSIEYLLIAALIVVVFGSLRYTVLELLLYIYSFFIEMICSPVL